ncbi:TPA: lysozyme family protein, partial [Streptococcus pyogenes]
MFRLLKRACSFLLLFVIYQSFVIHHNVQRVLAYKPMVEKTLAENDTKANVDLV